MGATRYSFCRNCAANCGLEFTVEDGHILSHRADADNLHSKGFICIKGDMSVGFHKGEEPRIVRCQRRVTGGFADIEVGTLMDEVAGSLGAIVKRPGPRSIAAFYGTCAYYKSLTIPLAKAFMDELGSPNIFSTMTIDQSAHRVANGRMGAFATGRSYIQDTDVIVLAGMNPLVSHGSVFTALPSTHPLKHLKALRERHGKLIIVDPRKTETARMADVFIQPRPGFDTDIFAALIRIMLQHDWHNLEFTNRY